MTNQERRTYHKARKAGYRVTKCRDLPGLYILTHIKTNTEVWATPAMLHEIDNALDYRGEEN